MMAKSGEIADKMYNLKKRLAVSLAGCQWINMGMPQDVHIYIYDPLFAELAIECLNLKAELKFREEKSKFVEAQIFASMQNVQSTENKMHLGDLVSEIEVLTEKLNDVDIRKAICRKAAREYVEETEGQTPKMVLFKTSQIYDNTQLTIIFR